MEINEQAFVLLKDAIYQGISDEKSGTCCSKIWIKIRKTK